MKLMKPIKLDDMHGLINDIAGPLNDNEMMDDESGEMLGEDFSKYYDLLKNAEMELYPGCEKFTKLSFIVRLFHIKTLHNWSNISLTKLLKLIKEAFPIFETLLGSFQDAQSFTKGIGA